MSLITLAFKSLLSRKLVVSLLVVSIGVSMMLLGGVQKIKNSAKRGFSQSVSGVDLIVGARTGDLQLLMYTVFHVGRAVSNLSIETLNRIQDLPEVKWVLPISLGDSHRGYTVVGTTEDYFTHFRYGRKTKLSFLKGGPMLATFNVVIGAEVAKKLGYRLGDTLYLSHGTMPLPGTSHHNERFTVVGILHATGTPVDKSLFVVLDAIAALHRDGQGGVSTLESVTGCFVGLHSKLSVFSVQRHLIDRFPEPLSAIIPGVSLAQLWSTLLVMDHVLFILTIIVALIAFIGLMLALFLTLNQRQKELALLRSMGCSPLKICLLVSLESLLITSLGVLLGLGLMIGFGVSLTPFLEARIGLVLSLFSWTYTDIGIGFLMVMAGLLVGIVPAVLAYRRSLHDGLVDL